MKLCDETITVFNKRLDDEFGYVVYIPTVIDGVSWYSHVESAVTDDGLKAANKVTVRVPLDADFSGKAYTDPKAYTMADPAAFFTFQQGDIMVKGRETGQLTPAQIGEIYAEKITIVGVTDNRRAPREKHWRVTGA